MTPSPFILLQDTPTCCCNCILPKGSSVEVIGVRNKRKNLFLVNANDGYHLIKGKYLRSYDEH